MLHKTIRKKLSSCFFDDKAYFTYNDLPYAKYIIKKDQKKIEQVSINTEPKKGTFDAKYLLASDSKIQQNGEINMLYGSSLGAIVGSTLGLFTSNIRVGLSMALLGTLCGGALGIVMASRITGRIEIEFWVLQKHLHPKAIIHAKNNLEKNKKEIAMLKQTIKQLEHNIIARLEYEERSLAEKIERNTIKYNKAIKLISPRQNRLKFIYHMYPFVYKDKGSEQNQMFRKAYDLFEEGPLNLSSSL